MIERRTTSSPDHPRIWHRTVIVKVVLMLDLDYKMSSSGTTAESTPQGAPGSYAKHPKLNVSTASTLVTNLLAVETACTTPRTPEILNSLIAMTNPLDDFNYNLSEKCAIGGPRVSIFFILYCMCFLCEVKIWKYISNALWKFVDVRLFACANLSMLIGMNFSEIISAN